VGFLGSMGNVPHESQRFVRVSGKEEKFSRPGRFSIAGELVVCLEGRIGGGTMIKGCK